MVGIIDTRILVIFLMALALTQGVYGIQITVSGGANSESGSAAMNIGLENASALNSQLTISGADIVPTTHINGPINRFTQTHQVTDRSGKKAQVYVNVANAPLGLDYSSEVLPAEGKLKTIEPWVSAEHWLTVPKANSIKCTATASYRKLSAESGIEEVKSKSSSNYATLTAYDGKTYASATQVEAIQTATAGSGNSIRIYGNAKDPNGIYSINTPIISVSGLTASFQDLDALSSAGTTTQVTQNEHVVGKFSSKAIVGKNSQTRTSNYGNEYDLNMQAMKGSMPTGTMGYYVNPGMATASFGAIQGAVNAAQPGDTINTAAGTYSEKVNINKGLILKGTGDSIASGFTLNAKLGTGSGGITAPAVIVNPYSRIQDGITLASSGGTVNVVAGTYIEDVRIDKSLTVNGAGACNTIVDGNQAGSVFTIGKHNPFADVSLSGMTIQNGNSDKGGGIFNNGKLTLTDSTICSNSADYGGGIYNAGTLNMIDGTVSNNEAAQEGGGIYNNGVTTVNDGSILWNRAGVGGGLFNWQGKIAVENTDITNNFAGYGGGGLFNYHILDITNSRIMNNIATWGGGVSSKGEATINGCTISNNSATQNGGGINNEGLVTVTSSTISGNTAVNGGGVFNRGTLNLNGGSITRNTANNGVGIASQGNVILNNPLGAIDPSYSSLVTVNGGAKIQEGVNLASTGGTVNMTAETYNEDVLLNKNLTLIGTSKTTASSFTLSAILGTGSGGITAPTINVKPGGSINDGLGLASNGGNVKVAVGSYFDNVNQDFYSRNIQLSGVAGSTTTNQITLNQPVAGRISGITANTVNVQNNNAKIQDGVTLTSPEGTVNVAAGTYYENVCIDKSVNVNGVGEGSTIVDGNQAGSVFAIGNNFANIDVTLSGMTIQGGAGTIRYQGQDPNGGGIYSSGRLAVKDCTISGNTLNDGYSYGGGIYNNEGSLTVIDSILSGNTATGLGGGIYNHAGYLKVTNSDIAGNKGSGIADFYGTTIIANSRISMNKESGFDHNGGKASITDSTISGNGNYNIQTATGTIGGGIASYGTMTIARCIISGNTGAQAGGISSGQGTMTITDSTISGNSAKWAGGIWANAYGMATITNSKIFGNTAKYYGGGILVNHAGVLNCDPSQVFGNTPDQIYWS